MVTEFDYDKNALLNLKKSYPVFSSSFPALSLRLEGFQDLSSVDEDSLRLHQLSLYTDELCV